MKSQEQRGWRSRRHLVVEGGRGHQVPLNWDAKSLWSCVSMEVAKDTNFWNERAHYPATAWMAAGGKGVPTVTTEAEVLSHSSIGQSILEGRGVGIRFGKGYSATMPVPNVCR